MNKDALLRKIKETDIFFFDLDGTLIDTEKLYFRFWKEACLYYGYELKDNEALRLRSLDGKLTVEYLSALSNGKLDYTLTRNKRIELMDRYFLTHDIEIKEGAKEFLTKLKKENKKVYIVTANSGDKAYKIIHQIHFENFIDDVVSTKEVERGKPNPDVYIYACNKLRINSDQVVVFEDSPNGVISSFKTGCFTIMVEDLSSPEEVKEYFHYSIKSFLELL